MPCQAVIPAKAGIPGVKGACADGELRRPFASTPAEIPAYAGMTRGTHRSST
jgi:hypothetical protein